MDNKPPPRGNQEQQNRKKNFRRPLPPLRNQRIPKYQQIIPPFLDNYVDEEGGKDPMENQNHHFDDIDFGIYFSQEDEGHISKIDSKKKSKESKQPALVDGDKIVSSSNLQT